MQCLQTGDQRTGIISNHRQHPTSAVDQPGYTALQRQYTGEDDIPPVHGDDQSWQSL
jgi:hypothetical protein